MKILCPFIYSKMASSWGIVSQWLYTLRPPLAHCVQGDWSGHVTMFGPCLINTCSDAQRVQVVEVVTRLSTTLVHMVCMLLHLRHCVLYCWINTVNAERPRIRLHSRHHQLGGDSEYGGSSTALTGLSAATSAHCTSHLVEDYQKMALQPHVEGEL